MNNVLSVDPGNKKTKVAMAAGVKMFDSGVCQINDINELDAKHLESEFASHSTIINVDGKTFVVGQYAAKMNRTKKLKKDKDTQEAYVRILTQAALFSLETGQSNIILSTLNPIGATEKKAAIQERLQGEHLVKVNNTPVHFSIDKVMAYNECTIASLALEEIIDVENFVIIDVGSSTINVAHFKEFEYIHRESRTVPLGVETFRSKIDNTVDYNKLLPHVEEIVDEVIHDNQKVYLITGDSSLFDRLESNPKLVLPQLTFAGTDVSVTYSNVIGAYRMASGE